MYSYRRLMMLHSILAPKDGLPHPNTACACYRPHDELRFTEVHSRSLSGPTSLGLCGFNHDVCFIASNLIFIPLWARIISTWSDMDIVLQVLLEQSIRPVIESVSRIESLYLTGRALLSHNAIEQSMKYHRRILEELQLDHLTTRGVCEKIITAVLQHEGSKRKPSFDFEVKPLMVLLFHGSDELWTAPPHDTRLAYPVLAAGYEALDRMDRNAFHEIQLSESMSTIDNFLSEYDERNLPEALHYYLTACMTCDANSLGLGPPTLYFSAEKPAIQKRSNGVSRSLESIWSRKGSGMSYCCGEMRISCWCVTILVSL